MRNILLVDDDPQILQLYQEGLPSKGTMSVLPPMG